MPSQSHQTSAPQQKQSKTNRALQKQYAKQQQRKVPKATLPDPALDISLDDYTSFVTCLKSSRRIMALLGAGLSAASGVPTFRGAGGFWREHDATDLATPEAFEKDPSLVWQFYNFRRHNALKAKPNRAHFALAKLAKVKPDFLVISQNIDGDTLSIRSKGHRADLNAINQAYPSELAIPIPLSFHYTALSSTSNVAARSAAMFHVTTLSIP